MKPVFDVHKLTVLKDPNFDYWMCKLFGDEWRWELSAKSQRMYAKTWNFGKMYSMRASDIRRIMEQK